MKTTGLLAAILLLASMALPLPVTAACTATVPTTTPDSNFVDNGNGTVTDLVTGLVWKRCSEGQSWSGGTCTGTASTYTWQLALQAAAASSYAGKSDWRLPNVSELGSIVERQCISPAANANIFPNVPALNFWSGSPDVTYAGTTSLAWAVNFNSGKDSSEDKVSPQAVRLVRGGW